MPLPNQYGINMGNVMSQASQLKTAKLNRENSRYMMERQKELDELAKEKQRNAGVAKVATMISNMPIEQQQPAFEKAVKMMPKEVQEAVAQKGLTAKDIPYIINDSLTLDQAYDTYIKNPREQKAKLQLEALKAEIDRKGEEQKQKNRLQLEETKMEGRKELEETKFGYRKELETIKNKLSKPKKKEFERLMDLLDNPDLDPEKRKRYEARLDKLSQSDMSSLLINANTVKGEQQALASELGLDDPYKLSTIDVTQLTPEQQARANQTASIIIKGLGANAKAAEKKMGEYGSMATQMQRALNNYEDTGNFRAGDEMVKKYFSNYFGLSEDELKTTEAAQALQSMLNIKIKADSGSAVSGQEMVRNVLETATPFMDKRRIISGVKNVAERYKGELESLKNVMGPIAFNLKYGGVLKNYNNIINAADEAIQSPSRTGKTLEELRGANTTKQIVRTGVAPDGRRVVQYSDGSIEYANQ